MEQVNVKTDPKTPKTIPQRRNKSNNVVWVVEGRVRGRAKRRRTCIQRLGQSLPIEHGIPNGHRQRTLAQRMALIEEEMRELRRQQLEKTPQRRPKASEQDEVA